MGCCSAGRLPVRGTAGLAAMALFGAGCVSAEPRTGLQDVSAGLRERSGSDLRPASERSAEIAPRVPDGIRLDDGLSRADAVAIALWNNPRFRAQLATLGVATADLAAAGILPNPVLSLLFPWGPKQLEATLRWPVEALWQRPKRVELAQRQLEAVANALIEAGLSLARDVKIAHAELAAATRRAELMQRAAEVRGGAAEAGHRVVPARERLRALIGLDRPPSAELAQSAPPEQLPPIEALVEDALAARPDVRVAEIGVEAAARRLGIEQTEFWKVAAVLDANGGGDEGFELGPGLDLAIPIFDRGQGAVAGAEAQMERAALDYLAVRARIDSTLREAHAEYLAAVAEWLAWRDELVPASHERVRRNELAHRAGQISYLLVLAAESELAAARLAEFGALDAVRKRLAVLESALGRDLLEQET